jgi:hypothetical protein
MSAVRRLLVGALVVLGVSFVPGGPAAAATVGTGDLDIDVSATPPPQPFTGAVVFDAAAYDLFGVPVNLGQEVGTMNAMGGVVLGAFGGTFTATAESVTPGELSGTTAGDFLCETPTCLSGPVSFVGTFSTVDGTVTSSWPTGLTYTFDGTAAYTGGTYHFSGRIAVNAFQPVGTAASPPGCTGSACAVTVEPPPTTMVNSASGEEVVVDARITFPVVTAAGDTTVTAVSNVAGQTQANFAFNDDATFLDVSTTAVFDTSGDSIELCIDFAIAGEVTDPLALRLMHLEGGVWVDVTTFLDPPSQTICGRVTSLSPFGVAVQTGCVVDGDCDDSNPCSADSCAAGACVHAGANAGAICRPAVDGCDVAETCDGAATICPPDGFATGAPCTDDGDACTDDLCDAGGACTHPSNGSCATTTTTTSTTTSTTSPLPENLNLTQVKIREERGPGTGNGGIRVRGDFVVLPPVGSLAPFTVRIQDSLALDRSHTFTSCSTSANGRVRCTDAALDGRFNATFTPFGSNPSAVRLRVGFLRQAISGSFAGPVQVTLTHAGGVVRTDTIMDCRQTGSGLSCKEF